MFILYSGSTQMEVFTGTGRLGNWLANMPQGWTLEYTPNSYTPGIQIAYRAYNGTVITMRGQQILDSFNA